MFDRKFIFIQRFRNGLQLFLLLLLFIVAVAGLLAVGYCRITERKGQKKFKLVTVRVCSRLVLVQIFALFFFTQNSEPNAERVQQFLHNLPVSSAINNFENMFLIQLKV